MATIEETAAGAADKTVRIPSNMMEILRQSYGSREKVLDWCLAFGVVASMAFIFRDNIRQIVAPNMADDPNNGKLDEPIPNQNLASAFPANARRTDLYTYNMPVSRNIRYSVGPASTMVPTDPSQTASYSDC